MAHPETDARHVEVDVLTGPELPRASHEHGDTKSITREALHVNFGTTTTDVTVEDTE